MAAHDEPAEERPAITLAQLRGVMDIVVDVPIPWLIAVAIGTVVSCVQVRGAGGGSWSVAFGASTTTVVLLGLIWLPTLVRVIALSGGAIRTPAGEASTAGVMDVLRQLDPETKREALPPVIAALEQAGATGAPEQRERALGLRHQLEQELVHVASAGPALELLREQAEHYEQVRSAMQPGGDRTLRMTQVVVQARTAVTKGTISGQELRELFAEGDGARVVTLAAWQVRSELCDFDDLIDALDNSRSAFEQYHALLVAQALPSPTLEQRETLRTTLQAQLADPDKGIAADASRAELIDRLLANLNATVPAPAPAA